MLTLTAYHSFISLGVDVAIFEVLVGGRFDAANVPTKPVVTGITALGLDHLAILGNTLPEIAWHKAEIYKTGILAFTVIQPPDALEVIRQEAEKVQVSEFHVVEISPGVSEVKLGIPGAHQRQNASLAMHLVHRFLQLQCLMLKLPDSLSPIPEVYATGLSQAKWPGRCQRIVDPSENGL
ncbi:unnamed protein product [Rhizoctonia solani]|uniref:Folylpolyglutamate synthase n=1 Tax=Rhizoctonia solani TaxID=456999 RepID=A0A8H3BFL0_9AGAM|nr:unnamed protein product [Rhizoctonia solani]